MSPLTVTVDGHELVADWCDQNPRTRAAIADALPIEGDATRWGEELYFGTDIDVPAETTQKTVPVGALAYWPHGNAICLFWGPTPASTDDRPQAASPVNVFAHLRDSALLDRVAGDAPIRLE